MEDGRGRKEEPCRVSFRDGRLASRKAEETARRRCEAFSWLESIVGPLGLPQHTNEKEFISCLRSGIVLCNAINKIQPGTIPKVVVANHLADSPWDIQPLPAYQYFENIRNFLDAVQELKLPSFEASDLERDTLEVGSAAKVVDCILALKEFHEFQQSNGGNGPLKHMKSPLAPPQSAFHVRPLIASSGSVHRKCLDMSNTEKKLTVMSRKQYEQDSLVMMLSQLLFNSKENIDQSLLDSWNDGQTDHAKLFSQIMSKCLDGEQVSIQDLLSKGSFPDSSSTKQSQECSSLPLGNDNDCSYRYKLEAQEKKLMELKALLSETREEATALQTQMQNDLKQLGAQTLELSLAASSYHQAIKENRHLYNLLQELKGNIRVFCRVRPIINSEENSCVEYIGKDGSLMVVDPNKPQTTRKIFQFNKIFGPAATQGDVYKETQALIRSVMDGYNVCIFAYGQTGAGKTYTMCGPSSESSGETGINHMALNDLFEISCSREDIEYEIHVQMVEIYNEQVRDLLAQDSSNTKLEIRNCSGAGGLTIPNANMQVAQSTSDVLNLMKWGEKNRASSSTAMNDRSSRSHSVLTVHVNGKDISGNTIRSCLHLVDLAGSERVDKSEATGDRLKEAQHINKSLSCLGDVIMALAQKNSHIPYRNSKLTQLLQNSLGGNAKMLMFAHVSPEADSYGETIGTLKFAQRASTVELGTAHQNKESSEIRELKDQIDSLKKALASIENGNVPKTVITNTDDRKVLRSPISRLKRTTDNNLTSPRARRLSIENGGIPKAGGAVSTDNRKVLNSPISRMHVPEAGAAAFIEDEKLSKSLISGLGFKQNREERNDTNSSEVCPGKLVDDQVGCTRAVLPDDLESSANINQDNFVSKLPRFQGNYRLEQRSSSQTIKLDEITPSRTNSVTKYDNRSDNKGSISRGSHIRKSIQNIGRLMINGSEKRNNRCPTETPSLKNSKNTTRIDVMSPITADGRLRRRQSLTNLEILGSGISRRSSLGGKSVDSGSENLQNARTPPPANKSTKTTKKL